MITLKIGSKGNEVKQLQTKLGITADGDFGKKTEEAVKKFLKENNLTVDGIIGPKTWDILFNNSELGIIKKPLSKHISKRNSLIKYLVIHFTAGSNSKKGAALNNYLIFNSRAASADFAVDDVDIVQFNPDLKKYYCWAVGDGKGKNGITNSNSIHIEMCSTLKFGTSAKVANHLGWSISEEVLNNTIKLSKYLMLKYNIPIERIVRHYDASGKSCPGIIGWNNNPIYLVDGKVTSNKNNSTKWEEFKNKLK